MAMCQHCPKSAKLSRRNMDFQLWDVHFEVCFDIALPPYKTFVVIFRKITFWISAAKKQVLKFFGVYLQKIQGRKLMINDATGKTLRGLADKLRRCRSKNKKTAANPVLINQCSKERIQRWHPLNFIDNDKRFLELPQIQFGILKFVYGWWQLKIKIKGI